MPTSRKQKKARKSEKCYLTLEICYLTLEIFIYCWEGITLNGMEASSVRPESPIYNTSIMKSNPTLCLERTKSGILPDPAIIQEELNLAVNSKDCRDN